MADKQPGQSWPSWLTALGAIAAVVLLVYQAFSMHWAEERATAAAVRRDLWEIKHSATVLKETVVRDERIRKTVVCGFALSTAESLDAVDDCGNCKVKPVLSELTASQSALLYENHLAETDREVGKAVDEIRRATGRLTGTLSLFGGIAGYFEKAVPAPLPAEASDSSQTGFPRVSEWCSSYKECMEEPADEKAGAERAPPCERPSGTAVPEMKQIERVASLAQRLSLALAGLPDCQLAALSRDEPPGNAGESDESKLRVLVEVVEPPPVSEKTSVAPDGQSGEKEGTLTCLLEDLSA